MTYTRNSPIQGTGVASAEAIQAWFVKNAARGASWVGLSVAPIPADLGVSIVRSAGRYGFNSDEGAAQIAHETAFGQSRIFRDKLNPAGIGAENDDPYRKALTYTTVGDGCDAWAAHLAGYVLGDGPWNALSPRYAIVKANGWAGIVRVLADLEQRWAWTPQAKYDATPLDQRYGAKIAALANDLVDFANNQTWEAPMAAQIPGFTWYPAKPTHYSKGRTARIRGGAQHYSGGTNSLPWLTSTSGADDPSRRVSATFLVKRNATMADRGWQLVRIEDTPWTTAYANPYTVSIEYEHLASQDIPDSDYEVLGQTWADIEDYVLANNLGTIDVVQGHKVWVNNPELTCPDGIDVDRVVREWQARRAAPNDEPERPPDVTDPDARYISQTRVWLQMGFKAFWESNADALRWLGYPVENERGISGGLSIQRFQRGVLIYDASQPDGWQITALPLDRYAEFGLSDALAGRAA